jgi:glycosyltransferase involved in cell wall biosynthesis
MQQIGISITTRNREVTAKETISKIRKYAPKGAKIIVVDDASDIPFDGADFRFEHQAGIAKAKNKCFELLEGCEHIFLFDDDCYPKVKDWHLPYVNSQYNHLMYIFGNFSNGKPNGNRRLTEIEDAVIYENPCGCMIYYNRICLDKVGGMDPEYGIWGFEHPDHSVRIYNAGLTPHKFMDVKGSNDLFFSHDKEQTIERSVPTTIRARHIHTNKVKYNNLGKSAHYISYLPPKNLILTCYFTSLIDPQRCEKWTFDEAVLNALFQSIPDKIYCTVLCDEDCGHYEFTTPKHSNPYLAKWIAFKEYLEANPQYDNVFCVDGTDVEVMHNPFYYIVPNKIYCGDENSILDNAWLKNYHPYFIHFIKRYRSMTLLNAGVLGGSRKIVLEFLTEMVRLINTILDCGMTDMALFNYVLRTTFINRIESGRKVTTVFKSFDKENRLKSWFKHK